MKKLDCGCCVKRKRRYLCEQGQELYKSVTTLADGCKEAQETFEAIKRALLPLLPRSGGGIGGILVIDAAVTAASVRTHMAGLAYQRTRDEYEKHTDGLPAAPVAAAEPKGAEEES